RGFNPPQRALGTGDSQEAAMPSAHYVHPEFGLLCPTPRLRRKLRVGLACLIFALIGGAVLRASNIPPGANSSSAITAATDSPRPNGSSANCCDRDRPHRRAGARARTCARRAEC